MGLHSKDTHGLRRRDIDHRDKQNFDAVEHIISASSLLDNIPDALVPKYKSISLKAAYTRQKYESYQKVRRNLVFSFFTR